MKKITLLLTILLTGISYSQTQVGNDIDGEGIGDYSGHSVALSSDGTVMAIGAPYNDGNGNNSGHVRVYENMSGIWSQIGSDINGGSTEEYSGYKVSISSDGSIVAIAAPYNDDNGTDSGQVRVYQNISGVWSQLGQDINGDNAGDQYGRSISLSSDGSILAIGASTNSQGTAITGYVKIFKNLSGTWTQIGASIIGEAIGDNFGFSVSLSSDGSIIAIGGIYNDGNGSNSGHVRIYKNINDSWTQIGSDINGEAANDISGYSVALSSDGSIVAIGALHNDGNGSASGHVRIYKNFNDTWTQIGADINGEAPGDFSGGSVSISADGSIVAIGAAQNDGNGTGSGHVRIYQNESNVWIQKGTDMDGKIYDVNSGYSVSMSSDGSIVAIGAPSNANFNGNNFGYVRVYSLSSVLSSFNFELNNQISLYPNPVKDILTIKLENLNEIQSISVLTLEGREILQNTKQQSINLEQLNTGIYLVKVTDSAGKVGVQKIVKE